MISNKQTKDCIIFFAPAFLQVGCDLVHSLKKQIPNFKLTAICTGGYKTVDYVLKNIDNKLLNVIYNLEQEEKKWVKDSQIDYDYIKSFENKFSIDYFGRVLTADRRVGNGYVTGGLSRPSYLADLSKKNSSTIPFAYIQGGLRLFENIFAERKYSFVFLYVVASSPALLISYFANYHKVTFRCLYHSRINDRNFLDSSPFGSLDLLKKKFLDKNLIIGEKAKKEANKFLINFRQKPVLPDYSSYFLNKRDNILKDFIFYVAYLLIYNLRILLPKVHRQKLTKDKMRHKFFYFKRNFLKLFLNENFSKEIPNLKFVYFPLHVDPEASTMVLSPYHTNQLAVIENLSKSIPSDHVLLVKEHIPMIGFRPRDFYKTIRSFPRVILVSPNFDQFSLISKASYVCSITGTAGLEGLLLRKKVLLISKDTPFSFFKTGLIVESDISKLNQSFVDLKNIEYLDDKSILKYLGIIFHDSFKMNNGLLWEKYDEQPKVEKDTFIAELTKQMNTLIHST